MPVVLLLLVCMCSVSVIYAERTAESSSPCCEAGQLLDGQLRKCYNSQNADEERTEPLIQCSDGEEVRIVTEPSWSGKFCIQPDRDGNTVVLGCLKGNGVTVRKCCPLGENINRTRIAYCAPQGEASFDPAQWITPPGSAFQIQMDSMVRCVDESYDLNIYVPQFFVDHRFKVDVSSGQSGQLVIPAAIYELLRQFDDFCVDQAIDALGNQEPIAVTCLPRRMQILRYVIRSIYPGLHFVSAGFLLITLIVYAILPPIRDNIQGMSMMCFLFCMLVVQTEYGAILSVPIEPHTWCFPKVWISTYFRYASSTWITVMGFNIWSQLSQGPRKFSRPQLYKRFAWCSVYAWGVALALNLTVVAYLSYVRQGRPTPRLCWFGNRVVSHLLSTPNVVLVTANLIFFIPSAIRVYGSLRFLRSSVSSPVALSRLEKDRITTIFRFFLLMQFYTIPRIVHEIVDTDRASPEFLAFSVSLYLLIGPAMFGFFVCKKEVFNLLSGLFIRHRDHFRSSRITKSSSLNTSNPSSLPQSHDNPAFCSENPV